MAHADRGIVPIRGVLSPGRFLEETHSNRESCASADRIAIAGDDFPRPFSGYEGARCRGARVLLRLLSMTVACFRCPLHGVFSRQP